MKPILFNTQMVQAILDNRKTQTRRAVGEKNEEDYYNYDDFVSSVGMPDCANEVASEVNFYLQKARYEKGDTLYVRETFTLTQHGKAVYKADAKDSDGVLWTSILSDVDSVKWKPSIHMPKKYARIFLKVTDVRVERLKDINSEEMLREGYSDRFIFVSKGTDESTRDKRIKSMNKWWIDLWSSTSKDGYRWSDNPYVFVYEFKRARMEDEA